MTEPASQRIDKWLWHARFAKTRTIAQELARSGRIRVNRTRNDSASRPVKIGDTLTMAGEKGVRVIRIAAIGVRRGPASEARALYEEVFQADLSVAGNERHQAPRIPRPDSRERRLRRRMKEVIG